MAKEEKETVEKVSTEYTREADKLYKIDLIKSLEGLKTIPQKNPLAYEVSRAIKVVEKEAEDFIKDRSDLMSKFLLRNEDGNYVITKDSQKMIDLARKTQKLNLVPTEFGYEVIGDDDAQFEYKEEMNKLLNTEVDLGLKSVDASKKVVKVGEERLPLLEVISDFYEIAHIDLLEKLKILIGL